LRSTEPPVHPPESAGRARWSAALSGTVLVVAVPYLAVGAVFGAMDVVVVAFAAEQGAPALAGMALAVYASGSLVAGLVYGLVRLPGTLAARYVACAVVFGLAAQLLLLVGSLGALVPVAFVAGLAIAPVLVSGLSLVESRVARSALTEALTWTTTGLTLGVTVGSALSGSVVDAWGAEAAFAVPASAAALAAVLALGGARLLRRPAAGAADELPTLRVDRAVDG
jgi:MFS family permease